MIYLLKSLFSPNTKQQTPNTSYALTILTIGAILNLTDRVFYGFVIDYFDLKYFTIFNLADIMITAGIVWLIISNWSKKYAF